MQLAALLWHLRLLSNQPVVVSGIGLARFLPILLLAPIGGVIADTFNRRHILFITQSTMALTALGLGLLTYSGRIQIWQIYLLSGIQAAAIAFDGPSRQSLVPNLVSKPDLANAFSLQSIASNSGSIAGPALSGVVISLLGLEYVYWINAASFIVLLLALAAMGPVRNETRAAAGGIGDSLSSIREGVQFILKQPLILSTMLLDFIATFFSSANTLLPFVARDILGVNEIAYGWLVSAGAIGGLLVGLAFSQRSPSRRQGRLLLGAILLYGAATILFGMTRTFVTALAALALIGGADAVSTIIRNTIRQLQTPDHIRGRMVSLNQIFYMGGPQLGEIEAGLAAQAFGTPFSIISGGAACILGAALILRRWPQLGRYSDETGAPQAITVD